MEEYQKEYNYYLERYKNGCDYISKNIDKADKYMPNLLSFLYKMNDILAEHNIRDKEIILNGFKEE